MSPNSSPPWSSCSVVFVLDLVDPLGADRDAVSGRVRSAIGAGGLPEGWSLSHVGEPAPGSPFPGYRSYRAAFSVSGRYPSLVDGCAVLRRLVDAGLSSGPHAEGNVV